MILAAPLETSQVVLRSLSVEAAGGPYLEWLADPQVTRYLESRFATYDRPELEAFIRSHNRSSDTLLLGIFCRDKEDEHIGNIKLGPIDKHHRRADIGILIGARNRWGKGYATEAIRLVTEHAFEVLDLHKLTAGCYEPNLASRRAFLRAGFCVEGTRPSHYLCESKWVDLVLLGCVRPGHQAATK